MLIHLENEEGEQAIAAAKRANDIIINQDNDPDSITWSRLARHLRSLQTAKPEMEDTIEEIRSILPQVP
jgi:hypothetical protein